MALSRIIVPGGTLKNMWLLYQVIAIDKSSHLNQGRGKCSKQERQNGF